MSGYSTDERVILTGYSDAYPWMASMIGEVGRIVEVKRKGVPAVRLSGLLEDPFWIAEKHVEPAPSAPGSPDTEELKEGAA